MIENILSRIAERYPLKEIELHDLAHLKASGMKFTVRAFMAEGLGHVSVMSATGFLGLMKVDTLIINPIALDLPLYSYDRIFAMGNDTLIVELYDTLAGDVTLNKLHEIIDFIIINHINDFLHSCLVSHFS